jgi:transposase-like protein
MAVVSAFWPGVMNELNHRGLKDILVAVIDGKKAAEAISAVYPTLRSDPSSI